VVVTYSSDAISANSYIARLNLARKDIHHPGISQDKVSGELPFGY
jgi:hypothetical protein